MQSFHNKTVSELFCNPILYVLNYDKSFWPSINTCLILLSLFSLSRCVGSAQAYPGELLSSGASLEPAAQTQRPALSVSAAA